MQKMSDTDLWLPLHACMNRLSHRCANTDTLHITHTDPTILELTKYTVKTDT